MIRTLLKDQTCPVLGGFYVLLELGMVNFGSYAFGLLRGLLHGEDGVAVREPDTRDDQRAHSGIAGAEARPEISRSTLPRAVALMRRCASSQYSSSNSAPTKNRPSSFAPTPLVPDPQKGSKTKSPSRVEATSARLMSRKGFWVGWYPWSFSRFGTGGRRHTEEIWEVGSRLFIRS